MPRLSVWAVRLALLYLLLGITFGALMLANKGVPFAPWIWNLLPAHIDILLFGFVIQLAMGVAFWILPRHRTGSQRGNENAVWAAIGLLNIGIWVAAGVGWSNLPGIFSAVARLLEGAAAGLFAWQVWWRIRPS
jgi:hypothetical protein